MVRAANADLFRITSRLATELIPADDWADFFKAILFNGHTQAAMMGRRLAGDEWPMLEDDRIRGLAAADADDNFLNRFLGDIKTGRYTDDEGALKQAQVMNRGGLYLKKMRVTASEAFVDAGEPDEEYIWKLGLNDHCADCPRLAALSPFTPDTLFAHPGDGDTECLSNCNCVLVRASDKVPTFDRVDL